MREQKEMHIAQLITDDPMKGLKALHYILDAMEYAAEAGSHKHEYDGIGIITALCGDVIRVMEQQKEDKALE